MEKLNEVRELNYEVLDERASDRSSIICQSPRGLSTIEEATRRQGWLKDSEVKIDKRHR